MQELRSNSQVARDEQPSTSRRTSQELRQQLPSCLAPPDSHRPPAQNPMVDPFATN